MRNKLILWLIVILLLPAAITAQDEVGKLLPSEALTLMVEAVNINPEIKRIDATLPYLSRVITTNLTRKEQFYLGEVYFWDFMPDEAMEMFSKFLKDNDDIGRASWQRAMQIDFGAYKKHDRVEKELEKFRKKFKFNPKESFYMFGQVSNLASKYSKEGDHNKVIELINDELKAIDYNGAYQSFQLPAYFFNSYKALGKEKEAFDLLRKAKSGLEQTLSRRKNNNQKAKVLDYSIPTKRVRGMQTIVTEKLNYSQMNDKFEALIVSIKKALEYYQINNEK